ncbi:hypothetical protein JTE90_000890 [Oedothorax gibbosus]|uniref:C3H1-type domain-containing protein n=1 Tax=Oedothorax gibbosus TaxID=931172 RepID=A0AAV6VSE5_9ARAC|nr:hypothetical protein JTE90_000890 [Oedothorax gibbosus]
MYYYSRSDSPLSFRPAAAVPEDAMSVVSGLSSVVSKDNRWLQLEVCREFQRNKCSRSDTDCKFAHPPQHVEVQNGRVTACYDSIKGRCNREKPPCKFLHPPQHLKDQLLINGRNHLALKNALLQQIPLQPLQLPTAAVVSGLLYSQLQQQQVAQQQQLQQQQQQAAAAAAYGLMNANAIKASSSPYLPATFSPYLGQGHLMTGLLPPEALTSPLSLVGGPQPMVTAQKMQRTDRLEVCREFQRGNCKRSEGECRFAHPPDHVAVEGGEGTVTVCMDHVKGRCARDQCRYFHPPTHLQAQLKAQQTRAAAPPHVIESLAGKKRNREPADDFILVLASYILLYCFCMTPLFTLTCGGGTLQPNTLPS